MRDFDAFRAEPATLRELTGKLTDLGSQAQSLADGLAAVMRKRGASTATKWDG